MAKHRLLVKQPAAVREELAMSLLEILSALELRLYPFPLLRNAKKDPAMNTA
jgi:hypothetical protein